MTNRKALHVDVIELIGSAYEIGFQQGQLLQKFMPDLIQANIQEHTSSTEASEQLNAFSPQLVDELRGLAVGSGIDLQTAIQLWSGYDMALPPMGCTSFATDSFYVRNYDFSDDVYDARLVLTKPEQGYASIGCSQQIIGRLDGMNEKGLVIGLHFVNGHPSNKGFLATTICRMILDQCATTEEAITRIKQIPHQCCFNFSIMDRTGRRAIVEASSQQQLAHYSSSLICTNHFESGQLKENNRASIAMSLQRKKAAQTFEQEATDPLTAYHLFNNEDSPLFFTYYEEFFGTLHTVVYCPNSLEVMIGIGGNAEPYTCHFHDWLSGDLTLPKKLIGTIMK